MIGNFQPKDMKSSNRKKAKHLGADCITMSKSLRFPYKFPGILQNFSADLQDSSLVQLLDSAPDFGIFKMPATKEYQDKRKYLSLQGFRQPFSKAASVDGATIAKSYQCVEKCPSFDTSTMQVSSSVSA